MKITLEIEDDTIYIRSDEFRLTYFKELDSYGYDGPEEYEDMCVKIVDSLVNE